MYLRNIVYKMIYEETPVSTGICTSNGLENFFSSLEQVIGFLLNLLIRILASKVLMKSRPDKFSTNQPKVSGARWEHSDGSCISSKKFGKQWPKLSGELRGTW